MELLTGRKRDEKRRSLKPVSGGGKEERMRMRSIKEGDPT